MTTLAWELPNWAAMSDELPEYAERLDALHRALVDDFREIVGKLLGRPGMSANLVPDAHLAALAIEHGLTLKSADTDFARFPGLRWENPLAS